MDCKQNTNSAYERVMKQKLDLFCEIMECMALMQEYLFAAIGLK